MSRKNSLPCSLVPNAAKKQFVSSYLREQVLPSFNVVHVDSNCEFEATPSSQVVDIYCMFTDDFYGKDKPAVEKAEQPV